MHASIASRCGAGSQWIAQAEPSGATDSERLKQARAVLEKVHKVEYIDAIEAACKAGRSATLDSDTYLHPRSYDQCLLAMTAWMDAVDAVVDGRTTAFALTRPPGKARARQPAVRDL
jgi:acetoin utilization deacetylase AcuC-like enzyme